jgi:predicted nucleic acid-binding protein
VTRQAVIVDTNVVVAGLLTAHAASPVARMLDGMLAATFPFVVSEALLAEYHAVLVRPALRELHGLSVMDIESLLTDIAHHAIVLVPVAAAPAPDPGEQLLWDLLAARDDLLLVTGDMALLREAGMPSRGVTPQSFLQGL